MKAAFFEKITVDNAVNMLTSSKYSPEAFLAVSGGSVASPGAMITVEGGDVRYRIDGSDPTATDGHLLSNGDVLKIRDYEDLVNFRVTRAGTINGTLQVSYLDKENL